MENTHNINFDGMELEVTGDYEASEADTGYRGGWSTHRVELNGIDIIDQLTNRDIENIDIMVIELNY